MQKTKLGISVGFLGAIMFFCCLCGGYVAALILAGYILLCEENIWLKKATIKGVSLMFAFSIITVLIGLIPGLLVAIKDLLVIFEEYWTTTTVDAIFAFLGDVVSLVRTVIFILLGVKAFNQRTINIPVLDSFIGKYMD